MKIHISDYWFFFLTSFSAIWALPILPYLTGQVIVATAYLRYDLFDLSSIFAKHCAAATIFAFLASLIYRFYARRSVRTELKSLMISLTIMSVILAIAIAVHAPLSIFIALTVVFAGKELTDVCTQIVVRKYPQ